MRGQVNFGALRVDIQEDKYHRYVACVTGPGFNLVLRTPIITDAEGRLLFCERIAPRILDMINDQINIDNLQNRRKI